MVELGRQSGPAAAAFKVVATPLVTLHVAANAKGLAAPGVRALEGLLARMRVAVDPERAGPRERLVACLADVAVLGLGKRRRRRGSDVVVVLPGVGAGVGAKGHRHWHGREGLGCGQPLARSTRAQESNIPEEGGAGSTSPASAAAGESAAWEGSTRPSRAGSCTPGQQTAAGRPTCGLAGPAGPGAWPCDARPDG